MNKSNWWNYRKQHTKHPFIDYHNCYETWGHCEYGCNDEITIKIN